jgi:hypothetical protein
MCRYSLFLACAVVLLLPAAVPESRAWYAYHYHYGGGVGYHYGGVYHYGGYAGYRGGVYGYRTGGGGLVIGVPPTYGYLGEVSPYLGYGYRRYGYYRGW